MNTYTDDLKLWYKEPANNWDEALPTGNGRLGGMVFGNIYSERIQLNEDSVWYGGPIDRNNPDASKNLDKIRSLLLEGKIKEAEELSAFALSGTPECQRHYETLGDLYLFFADEKGEVTNYTRELDLATGVIKTDFTLNGTHYTRSVFTSFPHQVMVVRLTSDKPSTLNFHTQLSRGNAPWNFEPFSTYKFRYNGGFNAFVDKSCTEGLDSSLMTGQCGGKGSVEFSSRIKVKTEGGSIKTLGNSVIVENANTATIYLTANTTFRVENPELYCQTHLEQVSQLPYEVIYQEYLADYQSLFNRVEIDVCTDREEFLNSLTTDERVQRFKEGKVDFGLLNLFFQYGRYLLLSSSRPGSLPANLQGIWNKDMLPIWDSKYTININTEMNYWPAETCNLSECHLPLFDLLERMRENGRKTAKVMYNCSGFMAHHNTDIWADTAPQDVCLSSTYWVMGAAWLCLHLWEHYQFSLDEEFLKQAYPTMKEASEFLLDFFIEGPDGKLITCPTISPENEYRLPSGETGVMCMGASMDNQITTELFTACMKASLILGIDENFRSTLQETLHKIPTPEIGRYGQIKEWVEDYEEIEPGHRHISHLFALHPGTQISPNSTPELAVAARKTLERRLSFGGGHTGWSKAWIINMWARLGAGDESLKNIEELIKNSTLPNLFDNHPPFQIDGNFGCTAGIAEMLLQSHEDAIHLLPALPDRWTNGYVKGLKARGGYEINMEWNANKLTYLEIVANHDGEVTLRYKDTIFTLQLEKGNVYSSLDFSFSK